jgi:CRISPR-associated protein (TIGR02584 family)
MNVGSEYSVKRPSCYPKRVLFAVSGLSPQIITETLHALAVAPPHADRFIPTCIEVLTTSEGAERIRRLVLDRRDGSFHRLCKDYGLTGIAFGDEQIHCVRDSHGQPLADIRSADDNARLADAITERIRQLTSDPNCALHVSLAGGRKTMSFYAGYAMSLFGREQDRLSHVLVAEPFESARDFWYPTPLSSKVNLHGDRGVADARDAEVSLAHIPFVRLRQSLPKALLQGGSGFVQIVEAADRALASPRMRLHLATRTLEADGQLIVLQPAPFALLVALASRALAGKPALSAPPKEVHDPAWAGEVLDDMRRVYGMMHVPQGIEESLEKDCSGLKISPLLSRLRRGLSEGLAPSRMGLYFDDGGGHRHRRYSIPLPAAAISLVHLDSDGQRGGKLAVRKARTLRSDTARAQGQSARGDDE